VISITICVECVYDQQKRIKRDENLTSGLAETAKKSEKRKI